ncbi:MAG: SAM-dependent methyltransferase [Lachnospiraceae bacterium]|nr:SAM-dependent methyltransferase [Lachnospiraceae bacterium]
MANEKLTNMLDELANEHLKQIVLSNPVDRKTLSKVRIRPALLKGGLMFHAEEQSGTQAFHKNLDLDQLKEYMQERMEHDFRQAQVESGLGSASVLVGKRGTMTVKIRRNAETAGLSPEPLTALQHNRQKRYILREGIPVPFLKELGVMSADGKIIRAKYDKFRQINRFLEFIEDILPALDQSRETRIIDFGCGKSYLTFAMYYYLHELKGYPVRITGLDLKKDVISRCSRLAESYGYENLEFLHGDIADYHGADQVDMVVTLHACDTATDYALAKAVGWGAKVILSVPCCQHELNRTMENPLMKPVFQYGIIKERMAALYTDALRAQILESQGYRTQILEFIDMEHTPKNILIRAVRDGKKKDNVKEIRAVMGFLGVEPVLWKLILDQCST